MPLLSLPYTTFDQVRELGLEVQLYCSSCRRQVTIDLEDPRLKGTTFCAGVRFTCSNVVKRWDAVPARVCNGTASVAVLPRKERRILSSQAILHCFMPTVRTRLGNPRRPADDPVWKPLFDRKSPAFGCTTCAARLTSIAGSLSFCGNPLWAMTYFDLGCTFL